MAAGDVSDKLVAAVRTRSGLESIQQITDEQIFRFLNRAQQYLALSLPFSMMPPILKRATGNMSASVITLPSDFMFEQVLMIGSDDAVARPIATARYDQIVGNTFHTPSLSSPYYQIWYDITSGDVKLQVYVGDSNSTASYKLDYVAMPPDIDTDTDPVFNSTICDLMVEFAVARVREFQRRYDEKELGFANLHAHITTIVTRHDNLQPRQDVLPPEYG